MDNQESPGPIPSSASRTLSVRDWLGCFLASTVVVGVLGWTPWELAFKPIDLFLSTGKWGPAALFVILLGGFCVYVRAACRQVDVAHGKFLVLAMILALAVGVAAQLRSADHSPLGELAVRRAMVHAQEAAWAAARLRGDGSAGTAGCVVAPSP